MNKKLKWLGIILILLGVINMAMLLFNSGPINFFTGIALMISGIAIGHIYTEPLNRYMRNKARNKYGT